MKYQNIKHLETVYNKISLFAFQLVTINDNGTIMEAASLNIIINAVKTQARDNYINLLTEASKFSDIENREEYHSYINDMIVRDISSLKIFHISENFNVPKFITS